MLDDVFDYGYGVEDLLIMALFFLILGGAGVLFSVALFFFGSELDKYLALIVLSLGFGILIASAHLVQPAPVVQCVDIVHNGVAGEFCWEAR